MTMIQARSLPALSLLVLALTACNADRAPAPADDLAIVPPTSAPAATTPPVAATPGTPNAPAPDDALARFDGYGDMRFGMSADTAKQAWGGQLNGAPGSGETCYYLNPTSNPAPGYFAFMIEDGKFVRYDVGNDKETAPGGGRVGMLTSDIEALYPGRVEQQPHKYSDGKYLRIMDTAGNGVLIFETDAAGKVTEWRVGVPPQVDYVEGCS